MTTRFQTWYSIPWQTNMRSLTVQIPAGESATRSYWGNGSARNMLNRETNSCQPFAERGSRSGKLRFVPSEQALASHKRHTSGCLSPWVGRLTNQFDKTDFLHAQLKLRSVLTRTHNSLVAARTKRTVGLGAVGGAAGTLDCASPAAAGRLLSAELEPVPAGLIDGDSHHLCIYLNEQVFVEAELAHRHGYLDDIVLIGPDR